MTSFFLRPIPLAPAQLIWTDAAAITASIGNLADPQPKAVFAATAPFSDGRTRIDIDLGADTEIDTVALLFHDTAAISQWAVYTRTAADGSFGGIYTTEAGFNRLPLSATRAAATIEANRYHTVAALAAPVTARYVRLLFYFNLPAATFRAGIAAVGKRLEPGAALGLSGIDWGMGRRIQDLSDVRILDGGERGRWKKAKVPEVRGGFSHLSDAELRQWWAMLSAIGESDPMLFVEDAALTTGQQERIHYGTLTGLDFYERRQADKSRIEFRLTHWL